MMCFENSAPWRPSSPARRKDSAKASSMTPFVLELRGTISTWNWNSKPKYGSKPSKPCTSVVQIIAGIAGIAGSSGCSSSFQNCIYTYMSWKDVCFVTHRTLNFGKDLPACPQSSQLRDLWKKSVAQPKTTIVVWLCLKMGGNRTIVACSGETWWLTNDSAHVQTNSGVDYCKGSS